MTAPASPIAAEGLGVLYAGRRVPALVDMSFTVEAGELLAVEGRTGAGKSTLALACGGFIPRVVRARVEGSARIGDLVATTASARQLAGRVGIVFSTPAHQLSASKLTVREELAFGLENLGVPREDMDARIGATLSRLGIEHLAEREPLALSGGEQQRVAIASIVIMGPQALVLDEPAAQLDPGGGAMVAGLLRQLATDGAAVLCIEHATTILSVSDRVLVMEAGRRVALDVPGVALGPDVLGALDVSPPTLISLAVAAGVPAAKAFDEGAIAAALRDWPGSTAAAASGRARTLPDVPRAAPTQGVDVQPLAGPAARIEIRSLTHRYPGGIDALRGVDLDVGAGEAVVIIGQNGSGKTTLVKHLNGLLRPSAGQVLVGGLDISGRPVSELARDVGFVFQDPDDQLFGRSVEREVAFGPRQLGLPEAGVAERVERALALVGLTAERATNPYDLGPSVRKLVALASVLAMEPGVIVLDEPTTGQDAPGVARIGAIVSALARSGRSIVTITHDMEFAARCFERVVVMAAGQVTLDGAPAEVFGASNAAVLGAAGLEPPPAARIAARLGLKHAPTDAAGLLLALSA